MDKKYIVKVKDTSDETILTLLDFGSVDYLSQITNIGSIVMDSKNVSKLRECECVLSVNESRLGKWLDGIKKEGECAYVYKFSSEFYCRS